MMRLPLRRWPPNQSLVHWHCEKQREEEEYANALAAYTGSEENTYILYNSYGVTVAMDIVNRLKAMSALEMLDMRFHCQGIPGWENS
jgi:hypothetical protein